MWFFFGYTFGRLCLICRIPTHAGEESLTLNSTASSSIQSHPLGDKSDKSPPLAAPSAPDTAAVRARLPRFALAGGATADGLSAGRRAFLRLSGARVALSHLTTHLPGMTLPRATAQLPASTTHRLSVGRYEPRSLDSTHTRRRFFRDRRERYTARLLTPATDRQLAQIDAMVRLEWQALRAEAIGTLQADREAREFRRLLDRLLSDFEKSLAVPPREPSVDQILAAINRPAAP